MGEAVTGTLGKYELRGTLGRGAMGTVFEAWDPVIKRAVAIKTMQRAPQDDAEGAESLARFLREAQAAGRLSHPNIVSVFDYGETADLAYLVMELVAGRSLKSMMDSREILPPATISRVMTDVLDGLGYSHAHGIVHRDIKPANIILTPDGRAKITDFGIARIESSTATQVGTVLGTPAYMSPEQLRGDTVDARTDIYSAGVMLYQMLTGERPFEGGFTAVMHRALHDVAPKPSDLSVSVTPAFDAVVARAMAKRPADRFQTAADFANAIRAAQVSPDLLSVVGDDATVVARPAAPPVPSRTRWSVIAAPAIGVAVLIGAGAWFYLSGGPPFSPPPPLPGSLPTTPTSSRNAAPPPSPASIPPAISAAPTLQSTPPAASSPGGPSPAAITPPAAPSPPNAATLRRAVADAIAPLVCTLVVSRIVDPGRTIRLTGLVGTSAASGLRDVVTAAAPGAPIDWQIRSADARYCPAINLIRPIAPAPAAETSSLMLRLSGNPMLLHKDQVIAVDLALPGFAAYLQIDYLQNDGSVFHLHQSAQVSAPAYAPAAHITLTDPSWAIDAPYGQDMIIAIASSAPLFAAPRNPAEHDAATYLQALRDAIVAGQARGDHLAGNALALDTSP